MTSRTLFRWVLVLISAAVLSCSDDKLGRRGQLMLVLGTDMQPPKDFDHVTVEVSSFGSVQFKNSYAVGEGKLTLPATLGIVAGRDPTEPVTIRVSSSLNHQPRTLREVVTTIPSDRIATLTVPIEWLCVGQVKALADGSVVSTCDNGESCVAGACESVDLDSEDLPGYDSGAVFGGGDGSGTGACFDTLQCFESGAAAEVDLDTCSISGLSELEIEEVSLALVLEPGAEGICGPEVCLVPLDRGGSSGWTERNGVIELPAAVCERLASGAALGVAATTVCDQKTAGLPTCGAWSSIDQKGTVAAEAPLGPWASAGAGGQGAAEAGAAGSGLITGRAGGGGMAGAGEGTGGAGESTAGAGGSTGGASQSMAGSAGSAGAGGSVAGAAGSAGEPAAPQGLLAYYRFDEDASAQLYADASGHGYDLTRGATSDPAPGTGGYGTGGYGTGGYGTGGYGTLDSHDPAVSTTRVNGQGHAAEFDGSDDYARRAVSGPFLSRALTVSASARPEVSAYLDLPLVSTQAKCPGGGYALMMRRDSSSGAPVYVFSYRYGSECSTREVTWTDTTLWGKSGGWRAVTATYEETTVSEAHVRLFVDGAQVAEDTFAELIDFTGVSELLVGTHRALLDDEPTARYDYGFFRGTLDEVQIHDRALSPDEVAATYQQTHCSPGPSGYPWRAIDGKGSQTTWLAAPSNESASVRVDRGASQSGGLAARLAEPGELVDLSAYDEAAIDADIPVGALFAVSLERGDAQCVWARQVGRGPDSYVIDLGAPSYCVTSDCGFDFEVDRVSIATDSSDAGVVDITVSSLGFRTTGSGVGARGPVGGATGPGGLCWQLTSFGEAAMAEWYVPLTSSSAEAMLSGDLGTEAYLETNAKGLYASSSTYLQIDASVSTDVSYRLRLQDIYGATCYWDGGGQGMTSYSFTLNEPTGCVDGSGPLTTFDIQSLSTIGLGKGPNDSVEMTVSITGLRFTE